jgi:hypothetical protein
MIVRKDWLAALILGLIGTGALLIDADRSVPGLILAIASSTIVIGVLVRAGLLALVVMSVVENLLTFFPVTIDPSAWYAPVAIASLALTIGLATWGSYTALAGQSVFGHLIED